ncbi:hypothetical protein [Tenacibaculum aiptasiae]|uniref:hypothetical protein n=1 Tax=Tenacibaculum aiptasiae TaxID=426481 RepID=UPI00232B0CBE|nr:hypothetical protein [Tenacibaculum aiptasiae]
MKKTFFLSKGIEKFSNLEINDLSPIRGGDIGIGSSSDDIIYYPTGGGGGRCPKGLVWSNKLKRCVKFLEADHTHEVIGISTGIPH